MEVVQNKSSLIFISANSLRCSQGLDFETFLNQDSIKTLQKKSFFHDFDLTSLSVFKLSRQTSHKSKPKVGQSHFSIKKNLNETLSKQEYRDIVTLRLLTKYEKIENYSDDKSLLDLRKAVARIRLSISDFCLKIISSTYFEIFIILVIIMNVITLSLQGASTELDTILNDIDFFYLIIYTFEAFLKITAHGFIFSRTAYMKDIWNYIDLVIVITGWIDKYEQSSLNLTAIRTLRILRPLRGITSISGLRVIVLALINSLKELAASIGLLIIYLLIFAVAGLQIWSGVLKSRCINIENGESSGDVCGNLECADNLECGKTLNNPNFGATNFDNVFYSFLTVFQCVTLEGWTDTMRYVLEAYNYSAIIYFVLLVFIGAYLLISLTLVVIKSALTSSIRSVRKNKELKENNDYVETNALARQLTRIVTDNEEGKNIEGEQESFELEESPQIKECQSFNVIRQTENFKEFRRTLTIPIDQEGYLTPSTKQNFSPTIETGDHSGFNNLYGIRSFKRWKASYNGKEEALKKYETIKSVMPLLSRMNSTIKVSKNFMNKIEVAGEIVPAINLYDYVSSSKFDVIPQTLLNTFGTCEFYSFEYRIEKKEDNFQFLLNKFRKNHLDYLNRYLEYENDFERFKKACLASSHKKVFFSMNIKTSEIIKEIKSNDQKFAQITGRLSKVDQCQPISPATLNNFSFKIWPNCFSKYSSVIQAPFEYLISTKLFNLFIYLCIISNTIILSIDYYGISTEMANILNIFNIVFTFIFGIEMAAKLLGQGLKKFLRDLMNYLDLVIVINSFIEFAFLSGGKSAVTAFRAIRIFKLIRAARVARIFRYLQSMNHIIIVISRSLSMFAYVALLLFLFIVVYSLLGMQIYRDKLDFKRLSRSSFDSFYWSFISIFQVLSIENWQSLLYDTMNSSAGPASSLFLVSWVFLGNFILLNLFLAILLDGFTYEDEDDSVTSSSLENKTLSRLETFGISRRRSSLFADLEQRAIKKREEAKQQIDFISDESGSEPNDSGDQDYLTFNNIPCEYSYFIFSKTSKIRILCYRIVKSSKFDAAIISIIVISSIKLIVETYTFNEPLLEEVFTDIDIILSLFFLSEFILKSISSGFLFDKGTYLKDTWNILDFFIIIISLVDLLISSISLRYIKILRLLRALRALRFVSHNVSMKIVVVALLQSIVAILNVVLVCLIVWVMFAILGVSLFGGKFYQCSNNEINEMDTCISSGYSWNQLFPNYDTLIEAMISLFIVSSEEGWPDLMYSAIDARDIGLSPKLNYNPPAGLFFITFIFIGTFFFMNLFIGVVFEQFNEVRKHEGSFAAIILTKEQMLWVEIQQLIIKSTPFIEFTQPTGAFRLFFFNLTRHRYFEMFILACVLLNMLQMCLVYDEAPEIYMKTLENINLAFTAVFIIEALFKLVGNGFHYFSSTWNKFDFLVVSSSIIDICLTYFAASKISLLRSGPQLLRVVKLFRISRLFRLFKSLRPLQTLLTIMKYSLPAIFNVLSLLILIFFVYAVMGVYLFYNIKEGLVISKYTNFQDFGMAMITLFRSATGENWYLIMHDCSKYIGKSVSYIYFCSFISSTSFIMLNLFIMVILQNYDDYQSNPQSVLKIFNKDIKKFKNSWKIFAIDNGQRVSYKLLPDLMYELGDEFGVKVEVARDKLFKLLTAMEIPIDHEGFVHYNDFLFGVLKRKYSRNIFRKNDKHGKKIVNKENAKTLRKLKKFRMKFFKGLENDKSGNNGNFFLGMIYAKTVFKAWKNYAARKKWRVDASASVTPRMTDEEFPGEVSEKSFFIQRHTITSESFD